MHLLRLEGIMSARSTIAATGAILAAATLGLPAAAASPAIPLSGGQETTPADPDGHGFFTYSIDGTTFCWTLSWQDIAAATAAHVHVGPATWTAYQGRICPAAPQSAPTSPPR